MDDDQSSRNDEHEQTNSGLDEVRKRALEALIPVMSDLKNIPGERKFELCMSAMRLTDDPALSKTALEAAQSITEPGLKAEALVELINEISYFQKA